MAKTTFVDLRLADALDALKRSRLVFFTSTVISLTVMIAIWNAHISWYRNLAMKDNWSRNPVTQEVQKEAVSEWLKTRYISVSPLGIRVGSRDAAPLASLSLLIVSGWFFYCIRRHNYLIEGLLIDTRTEERDLCELIYCRIVAQLVFVDTIDEPIRRLNGEIDNSGTIKWLRSLARLLPYLPAMTIVLIVALDLASLFWLAAPLRDPPHNPLWTYLGATEKGWVVAAEVVGLLAGIVIAFLTRRTLTLERGVASDLREYAKLLERKK